MKLYALLISSFILLLTLGGCNSSPVTARATGFAYEIVVTMDRTVWDAEAGRSVKDDLESAIPGLPQPEAAFKITYVTPADFNGLLTYVRNILILKIDNSTYTKVSLSYENDRWTQGQVVLTMTAPDQESIIEFMKSGDQNRIAKFFTNIEMNRAATLVGKNYSDIVMENVKSRFDIMLSVPTDITYTRNAEDFFWASNNANTGRTDIIVYTFPYTDPNTFTEQYLIAKRDSILKENLPGSFPDSYMATESRWISYTPVTIRGKYCGVLRGLWKMVGDMMGGPFVSHVRLDEVNNRVIVVEGFVYAPETNKRNYIRRIEAALYTLRLPGEFDQPAAAPLAVTEREAAK
ncbi:hypothetical protein M2459_002088 [Parabacteroides sp. PF5-5]|uniref:DUF4837 family protein n=1 Tax=unclassified Parabacteroides TaxID=2649774 RepID=UPI002474C57D|nr:MULTISPECIES: DUF4837 family protein [unclassified Parabacteroides]MDH6305621.1 hypothetical protein [Parabacteroides sp. PH5-39]MDH6316341.1 hypothetical protein [Parabacteroides sp. PF5-13]MDH6319824.1 hypothetical protein [Parabacteroides sp. PH5-13]MDH6323585.1 hypothetical protein [Parabacteroides sp. PH5-8]MDH6327528.1 hypothetical protein [Parabacteroides sp. PH5-41]